LSRSGVDAAVAAIRAGELVVIPTETVYGLAATPYRREPVERLYALKGRDLAQPSALVTADVDVLLECVPELGGRAAAIARALLPGPFTLVLPNPGRRFPWLTGTAPEAIGVRVPAVAGPGAQVLAQVGALVATSANLPGGPEPRRLEDVPAELTAGCAAAVDGGALPGVPSTVLDFTGPEPRVVREGAAPSGEALGRVAAALA
jgi:L-threonylcarbamoyladenylate synthase